MGSTRPRSRSAPLDIELDERHFRQGGFRPDGAVLLARILWALGDEDRARALVDDVEHQQAAARAAGKDELLLLPNDDMLLAMAALLVRQADGVAWEALMPRAREVAQGQELIEVLEAAGLAAVRRGDRDAARRWWQEAVDTARRIPTIMAERIGARLAGLDGTAARPN